MGTISLGDILKQVITFASAGTITQMQINKDHEISIKNDGAKAYLNIKINRKVEHHSIKLTKRNNSQSS